MYHTKQKKKVPLELQSLVTTPSSQGGGEPNLLDNNLSLFSVNLHKLVKLTKFSWSITWDLQSPGNKQQPHPRFAKPTKHWPKKDLWMQIRSPYNANANTTLPIQYKPAIQTPWDSFHAFTIQYIHLRFVFFFHSWWISEMSLDFSSLEVSIKSKSFQKF